MTCDRAQLGTYSGRLAPRAEVQARWPSGLEAR